MKQVKLALRYLAYLLKAESGKNEENSFIKELLQEVIFSSKQYYAFPKLMEYRNGLLVDSSLLSITDFGAGSSVNSSNKRKVLDVARHSSKPKKFTQLFFRLVNHYQCNSILELGTSLGISTSSFAMANSNGNIVSIEGCPETAERAKRQLALFKIENATVLVGEFSTQLDNAFQRLNNAIDLMYIDGNHRKKPTLDYFEWALYKIQNESILIFDDIHWSEEMEEAWEKIKSHKKVTLTIDLFFVGLVFFRSDLPSRHLTIRF